MKMPSPFKYRRDGTPYPANAVWRLVSGFPTGQRERRIIVVIEPQAAIDDSTDQPNRNFLVLAGFIAPASKWADFSNEWQAALDLKPKLEYFKMNDANLLVNQFAKERGWTEALRDDRVITLTRIIKKYAILRIHASIRRLDFEETIAKVPVPYRNLTTDHPYVYLFTKLIVAMGIRSTVVGINEPCDFVFDEQSGVSEEIFEHWPNFKDIIENRREAKFPTFIGNRPMFRKDHEFKPLQAADLFANQMRSHIELSHGRKIIVPPNRVLQQLLMIPGISHDSTREELEHLRDESLRWRDTLLGLRSDKPELVGFAETSAERRRIRKRARKARKASSSKKGQPS